MFQFTKVTRDRGALVKDDRLDALAGAVSHWVGALSQDSKLKEQALRDAEIARWAADPLLHRRYDMPAGMRVSATPTTIRKRI
jgi:hypothetical protein